MIAKTMDGIIIQNKGVDFLDKRLIEDIVCILNEPISTEDKQKELATMQKNRRGNNKKLLYIIETLLDEYTLPIHFKESLDLYCLKNAKNEIYQALSIILEKSKCVLFNGICAEILWMHFHNKSFARISIESYSSALERTSGDDERNMTQLSLSICRIYSKIKIAEYSFQSFFDKMTSFVSKNYDKQNLCILFILNGLSECGENHELLRRSYEDAICYYENKKMFEKSIPFLKGLEHLLDKYKKEGKKSVIIRIAKNYEHEADLMDWDDASSSLRIIDLIHKSMNAWERAKDASSHTERERLAKRIDPVKKLSLKTLKSIQGNPIDISDWVKSTENFIENATFEAVIYRLAKLVPLKSISELKETINSNEFHFSDFFETTIINDEGRIMDVVPAAGLAKDKDPTAILEREGARYYSMIAGGFIQPYLCLCQKKVQFTEDNLSFLIEDNLFVPENRKTTFLKGLVAGFNLDLSTAMHLLMPQIENVLRCLAQECGAVVYKTYQNGVEECLSLESILKKPKFVDCLDETFLFNLKLFYTSEHGFGMRNIIGHGLKSDEDLQTASSLAVWWFTLKICCMYSPKLFGRLKEQTKKRQINS